MQYCWEQVIHWGVSVANYLSNGYSVELQLRRDGRFLFYVVWIPGFLKLPFYLSKVRYEVPLVVEELFYRLHVKHM